MTDIGSPYTAGDVLLDPIPPDGADWRAWLHEEPDGSLGVRGGVAHVFDALALPRVTEMVRQLYGLMLASVDRHGFGLAELHPADLDLYDLPTHLRAVLDPLVDWANEPSTHRALARELERDEHEVADVLGDVHRAWSEQASTSWYGPPGTRAPSIQTILLRHLIVLHNALRNLCRVEPDPRWEHTDLMLLFAAHYLREARLERLWIRQLSDVVDASEARLPPPEDIAGHWFWRTFTRLLELTPA